MYLKFAFGFIFCLFSFMGYSQFHGNERAVLKNLEKKKWGKAKQQLIKGHQKDSLNPAIAFLWSRYYFNKNNPSFNIDSANHYFKKMSRGLAHVSAKEQRFSRSPMDTSSIARYRHQIDSTAFARARVINTEGAFLHFLQFFSGSEYDPEAVTLRDEAAYQDAVKLNSYQGFLQYLEKYPQSAKAIEAKNNYERLLYVDKTRDRTLHSYKTFLTQYPATPYRREIEKNIFEISTASGSPDSLMSFLKQYPHSSLAEKGRRMLFYLNESEEALDIPPRFFSDSLNTLHHLNEGIVVPIFQNGKFGFLNDRGKVIIAPAFQTIPDDYICGNIAGDLLIADSQLLSRNGTVVSHDSVDGFEDIGNGLVIVDTKDCSRLCHKAGFCIDDCISQAKIVGSRFVAVQKNNAWALYSFAGKPLTFFDWMDISVFGNVLIFKNAGGYKLTTLPTLVNSVDGQLSYALQSFDDVKVLTPEWLWAKSADFEGVFDRNMQVVIPFEKYVLSNAFFGVIAKQKSGYVLFSKTGEQWQTSRDLKISMPWVALRTTNNWSLINGSRHIQGEYDSISFAGPFALGYKADSLFIYFDSFIRSSFQREVKVTFVPGKDSVAFLQIHNEKKKWVYDHEGQRLFSLEFDQIQYVGNGYFIFSRKDKKGLVDITGKIALQPEYDAIGNASTEVVTMLKSMKFGAFNLKTRELIKPQYEKNLSVYKEGYLVAFQKGFYGFIDWNNKPQSKFEFEEIQHWNDSSALVKRNWNFAIYSLLRKKLVESSIKEIDYVIDTPDEKVAIIKQDDYYGVISNRDGFIIPATFSNLINVGSDDHPVYFTEKHVEEASIFVVIYYDRDGKFLYRQVYEEDDYEKILCPDN